MTVDTLLREIFENNHTIAVYGMSSDPEKPAHYVPALLRSKGYTIIPINPRADAIAGMKSYSNLKDIEEAINILQVFRPSDQVLDIVKEAVERKKQRGDIGVIWLQLGIKNEDARKLAANENITFIENRCMKIEYLKLTTK